ncbi:unnamed protein product [Mytilus coruscus]|uniref:Uncharacterized protein n=1 Tax=Mytilus coruscus TaxID=42192 RepID=A0A6J8BVB0_MYTCO|nr:unnamed protein product [Mytilus coruscus]
MTSFVQVTSSAPSNNNNNKINPRQKRSSILSPLPEDSDEEEPQAPKPPTLDDFIPTGQKIFLTEEDDCFGDDNGNGQEVCSEEITLNGLNGDCFIEDEFLEGEFVSDDSSVQSTDDDYDTDLEVNEEEWLHPSKNDYHDTTGKKKYMKVCSDMGIHPVSYIVNNLEQKELKLRFHGLDQLSIKAISIPLETNTNVEILNLQGNGIDPLGARCLCRVLRENLFLTEVVLSENKIGTEGAIALCQFLKGNRNLIKVDLTDNEIGDSAGQSFYEVLKGNKSLKELLLCNNHFEENAATWFRDGLSENDTLEVIDLGWNPWKTRGAVCLAEGLAENVGLRRVRFVMAGLGKLGAQALMDALLHNRTLQELDISYNRIPVEGANCIASGLKTNDTLKILKIGNNPFDADGAMVILEAVESNETCAINLLDFSNIMVKIEFKKIQDRLMTERNMKITNEGVLPDTQTDPETFAKLTAFRKDPIEAFKRHVYNCGVNLCDVFNVDNDLKLSVVDFKDLIKGAGIDIQGPYFSFLMRVLEENGNVNYWRLFDKNANDEVMETGKPGKPSVTIKIVEEPRPKGKKSAKDRSDSAKSTKKKKSKDKTKKK